MNNATFNVVLAGQWISLSRTVKRSFITLRGKIRVKNLGSQTAPSSVLYVYQSSDPALQETDQYLEEKKILSIPAGAYVDLSLRLSVPYDGYKAYLIAALDATNALLETDETNNMVLPGLEQ